MDAVVDLGSGAALREWRPTDVGSVLALYTDPDVCRWDPSLPMTDVGQAAAWLELRLPGRGDGSRASWAVTGADAVVLGCGLHRVELHHDVANSASCAVAQRAAFALEGTRRAAQPTRDGWADEHLHAWVAAPSTSG